MEWLVGVQAQEHEPVVGAQVVEEVQHEADVAVLRVELWLVEQVDEIPRTLTGKKQELPIKKLLLGQPLEKVVNRDAMANPGCLDWYVAFARQRAGASAPR